MKKYIDADKLKAEIVRLKEKSERRPHVTPLEGFECMGKIKLCDELISIIDSLQQEQPEVDLEKEFKKWWDSVASGKVNVDHSMYWYMKKCAEHFYELGLNARKQ